MSGVLWRVTKRVKDGEEMTVGSREDEAVLAGKASYDDLSDCDQASAE